MVHIRLRFFVVCAILGASFGATAAQPEVSALPLPALVDRLTWGVTTAELARARELGAQAYIDAQLRPDPRAVLPTDVQRRIDGMSISKQPAQDALIEVREHQLSVQRLEGEKKVQARKNARQISRTRTDEAGWRATWRALYSPNQLQEQMTWFWMNHFNVYSKKGNVGVVLDDYEERAIRPRALGKFRDLLEATIRSPAMLIYLDNQYNRAGHINENYARELMELHTLGVQGGYTQKDVQELARILTGLGITYNSTPPKVKGKLQQQVVQEGAFLFHPAKHDYGDKVLLGQRITGQGMPEIDEAVDILARHASTARHISVELAQYFVADDPPKPLIDSMVKTFQSSDGDIAATLRTMFSSAAFAQSLTTRKFKDPVHYVYSAMRLAYAENPPVTQVETVNRWLSRMGQPLYQRLTPDGYPLTQSDWSGSGQMTVRFELARQIVTNPQSFYHAKEDRTKQTQHPLPRLISIYEKLGLFHDLSPATRQVIDQAKSAQDANIYLLASPEFMRR